VIFGTAGGRGFGLTVAVGHKPRPAAGNIRSVIRWGEHTSTKRQYLGTGRRPIHVDSNGLAVPGSRRPG